jgi:hypothetical protein
MGRTNGRNKSSTISRTFVLGAGFSAGAGFPIVRNLKDQVIQHAQSLPRCKPWFEPGNGGFEKGQFYAGLEMVDPKGSLQFEEILIALGNHLKRADGWDPCHRTFDALRDSCGHLLWKKQESIEKVPECYENFARYWIGAHRFPGRVSAIVSFNWDLLTERALADSRLPWTYSDSPSTISILKPHGSINWNDYLNRELKTEYSGWRPICPGSKLSYDASNPLSNPDRDDINPNLRYMIFPGDPESDEVDAKRIWQWVSKAISEREGIVFIGYSLPEYDGFSLDFFEHLSVGKGIEVYNPSKDHLEKFRRLFGPRAILELSKFEDSKYAGRP